MASLVIYRYDKTGDTYGITRFGPVHTVSDHIGEIVPGYWGQPGFLLYDREAGRGDFYHVETSGEITRFAGGDGWRNSWDIIIGGHWSTGDGTDLFLYDRRNGEAEFYAVDADGTMHFLRRHTGWRKTWKSIVPGHWSTYLPYTDLLLYERHSGDVELHRLHENGRMSFHRGFNFGANWFQIVPGVHLESGDFTSAELVFTDLVLYNRQTGVGEFQLAESTPSGESDYRVEVEGFRRIKRYTNWRRDPQGWDIIIAGTFSSHDVSPPGAVAYDTGLLFYSRKPGEAEFYRVHYDGSIEDVRHYSNWSSTWRRIVPGSWSDSSYSDLLFYG